MDYSFLRSRTLVLIIFIFVYAALSLYVMQRFSAVSNMGESPDYRASLIRMVTGTAERPFVYRVLVPSLIRMVVEATPDALRQSANVALQHSLFANALGRDSVSYMQAVMAAIVYLCLCGYIVVLYKLGTLFFPQSWAMALFMPIVGMAIIPAFTFHGIYVYDFAVLFLTSACYYAMATRQWRWYFLWFFLACMNKETSIFILIFFALWYLPRLDTRQFIMCWAGQWFIYVFVRLSILLHFSGNPGVILEHHGELAIRSVLGDYNFPRLGLYIAVLFLLTYRWTEKPLFARYILWIYPMMMVAYTLYGYPGEYRVFFDLFPLLTVLVTHTLIEGTGIARSAIFNRSHYVHAPPVA